MKSLHAAIAFLVGPVALAAPTFDGMTDVVNSSVNPQHELVAALDRRELEKRINRVLANT